MPVRTPTAAGERPTGGVATIPEVLGDNVRAYRLLRRLEQEDVAERMQALEHPWRRATVSEVERARRNVTTMELLALVMALGGVPVAHLLDPRGAGGRTGPPLGLPVTREPAQAPIDPAGRYDCISVALENVGALICAHGADVEVTWDGARLRGLQFTDGVAP